MTKHHETLEKKLVTLIRESERLYKMLDECLKSRERLQHEIEDLKTTLAKYNDKEE
jgi:regulator of replication initiation timing